MKIFLSTLLLFLFQPLNLVAEVKISNYKNYENNETKFELEKITNGLNFPWGMTFIDDENLLITEKKGRLYKVNIKKKFKLFKLLISFYTHGNSHATTYT